MPVTREEAGALALLAASCRPTGASRWDHAGIVAAIGKVAHLALPEVVHALIRAAEDRTARTPSVITNLQSPHWRDRDPDRQRPRTPYDPAGYCGLCGKPLLGHLGDHEPVRADKDSAQAVDSREGHAERLKRIRDEAASKLCRHHVPPNNCKDCTPEKATTKETRP